MRKIILKGLMLFAAVSLTGLAIAQDYANKNKTGSCDSTCFVYPSEYRMESGYKQRMQSCGTGYKGGKLEYSIKDENANWTSWQPQSDTCVCVPSSEAGTGVCPAGQKGTIQTRRDWTCPSLKSGAWTSWYETYNDCYTPCTPLPAQSSTQSCPSGQAGTVYVARQSSCQSNDRLDPVWGNWYQTSNDCYVPCSPQPTEYTSQACPAGYNGNINYARVSSCQANPRLAPVWGNWTETSRNCTVAIREKNISVYLNSAYIGTALVREKASGTPNYDVIQWNVNTSMGGSRKNVTYNSNNFNAVSSVHIFTFEGGS